MRSLLSSMTRTCSRVLSACVHRYERFHYRRIRHKPNGQWPPARRRRLLGAGQDLAQVAAVFRELFPDAVQAGIRRADAVCNHVFDLLGSGPTRLSPPAPPYRLIDWHRDFKSGYTWSPRTFYRDIRYGHVPGVDVKVPWELSRFQHLSALGQAHVLTGNRAYAAEFTDEITDWIRRNPVGFGVNWMCTMDVAIRAANWLTAAEYFREGDTLNPAFLSRFYSSLHEHARFIRHHLERGEPTTNHYLADIVGLLFIAVHCPFFPESRRWRAFAIRELVGQMKTQVYADGCHFEASTCYDRLALELFLFATLLVVGDERDSSGRDRRQTAERIFGSDYVERLRRMFVAILHLLKPDGRMPQIGDNDSGRFLTLGANDILDMRYLLSFAAVFFDEPQFKVNEFGFSEDALWLFGPKGYEAWNSMRGCSVKTIESRSFPQAGWHVIRHDDDYCIISCGRSGPGGRNGHAHNDKLSFELMLDGRDVVVDPGTYLYTPCPGLRNRFRSTSHHNTVSVDGCEQSRPLNGSLFRLVDRTTIRFARLTETVGWTRFEGEIEYADIVHRRVVTLDRQSGRWTIEDRVSGSEPRDAEVSFHLSPHVTGRGAHFLERDADTPLVFFEIEGGPLETRMYDYSPGYGVRTQALCLCVRMPSSMSEAAVTTVFSHRATQKSIEITPWAYAQS